MTHQNAAALGIMNLERGLPPGAPAPVPRYCLGFDFPVIVETVEGAWVDRVIPGDPTLEQAHIDAARKLVARGAVAISANCGFTIRHQAAVAAAVDVPVVLSSLLLLPLLLRQYPKKAKIALLTADSANLQEELIFLNEPADRDRVVVAGIEGGELLANEMMRPPPVTPIPAIERDVVDCVTRVLREHPDVGAFLFECTAFPMVAPTVRRMTGLPTYDIADLCRMTYATVG